MISIVLIIVIIAIELFYLTQICSFLGCFFEYVPLFILIGLRYILHKVLGVQGVFGQVPSPLCQ